MLTRQKTIDQLNELEIPNGATVIMHTSLRSIGRIEGGAEALLDTLINYFTERDTVLIVPTHTWHKLGTTDITLDMLYPETCLGVFPTVALFDPRGKRSENPTHSVVAFGQKERVEKLLANEAYVDTPASPNGVYAALASTLGYIMLVGVGQDKNTFIHSADEMLGVANRIELNPTRATVRCRDGRVIERDLYMFNEAIYGDTSLRFPKYEAAFRYHNLIKDGNLGEAKVQLADAGGVLRLLSTIYERAKPYDPMSDDAPLDPKLYQ